MTFAGRCTGTRSRNAQRIGVNEGCADPSGEIMLHRSDLSVIIFSLRIDQWLVSVSFVPQNGSRIYRSLLVRMDRRLKEDKFVGDDRERSSQCARRSEGSVAGKRVQCALCPAPLGGGRKREGRMATDKSG